MQNQRPRTPFAACQVPSRWEEFTCVTSASDPPEKLERPEPGLLPPPADRPAFHADNWNMATAIAAPERYPDMEKPRSKAALWLLIIPYIGLLWPPFYNIREPSLFGFPFFYWYQLLWVPVTATLTWIAYRSVRHDD
ncbi:hypothetical protein NXC12_PB00171 (plasmid) [Rhizobium etli]|uniref:DUF3311 domain-containing protein n=2 Tax=Rhizobium etli TaxID=29449 RepID=A0AAN1BJT3_RHIET|nr:hypothetical protein NXC12_PB00171 [Rhizobium etli]